MKKSIKKKPRSQTAETISLLKGIKRELVIERKTKLKNALILATAIVMFAVPLNFMVEVTSNYLDSSSTGDLEFMDYYSPYYWLFFICIMFVITAFWSFYRPIARIFMASFDWESAFRDVEEENKHDEYFMDPDGEMEWYCDVCEEEFVSERQAILHESECKGEK